MPFPDLKDKDAVVLAYPQLDCSGCMSEGALPASCTSCAAPY